MANRHAFTALDIVNEIWTHLELPASMLSTLSLPGITSRESPDSGEPYSRPVVRSSFKIGHLAQSTIALSALGAVAAHSSRSVQLDGNNTENENENRSKSKGQSDCIPRVTVPLRHAVLEFQCERLYTLAGAPPAETWGPVGGLHPTRDGYVRIHDAFPHHRRGALAVLGLPETCVDRDAVSEKTKEWRKEELERVAVEEMGLAVYALRSFAEWDRLQQAGALGDMPVNVRRVYLDCENDLEFDSKGSGPRRYYSPATPADDGCPPPRLLSSLRVLELSRVIAAPVAGKTLAAHGADVLWVTSPHLPALPALDREFARGKRSVQLDLDNPAADDKAKLLDLARTADVVLQGYRPGSLARRGLDVEALARVNPGIIVANLSAFGPTGPWSGRRGFDSLVQTCSGIGVAEAERYGADGGARALPCQALDHGAGFLLAAGICAAVWHREEDRRRGRRVGAYVVDVSLAGVGKYLRSLGQFEGRDGFEGEDWSVLDGVGEDEKDGFFETGETAFGEMRFLRHSANVEGFETGWDIMPTPLGASEAVWRGS